MLGLNKDASHFPNIDLVTSETRRRLWWYLFYCDVSVALASGLPPLIENTSWDVHPISELRDECIGTESVRDYEAGLSLGIYQQERFQQTELSQTSFSISSLYAAGKYQDAGQ